jgi:hypothetical protein
MDRIIDTERTSYPSFAPMACVSFLCPTNTYQSLHTDTDLMAPIIQDEVQGLLAARKRSELEAIRRRKQEIVAKHYHRLKLPRPAPLMPSLQTFRQMSTIALLEKSDGAPERLNEDLVNTESIPHKLVNDMLDTWRKTVRRELAAKLNVKPSKDKTVTLPPAERLNARFLCTACGKVSKSFREDKCLVSTLIAFVHVHH